MDTGSPRTGGRWIIWFLLCTTSACGGEGGLVSGPWCNQPGREWDLFFSAFVLGLIAAVVVWRVRRQQLQHWNLRNLPVAPSVTITLWTVVLCAVVPTGLLSLSTYSAEPCAPDQKMANIVYLWAGALVGAALCLFGLIIAKRQYVRKSRR